VATSQTDSISDTLRRAVAGCAVARAVSEVVVTVIPSDPLQRAATVFRGVAQGVIKLMCMSLLEFGTFQPLPEPVSRPLTFR
jgi:hypothetical protein